MNKTVKIVYPFALRGQGNLRRPCVRGYSATIHENEENAEIIQTQTDHFQNLREQQNETTALAAESNGEKTFT